MPVRHRLRLSSHSLFVAEVVALHVLPDVLNGRNEVDFHQACYQAAVVRERPVDNFRPDTPRQKVHELREVP
jgi:flavin reductase (DIM6/NTAB) family NADH-FMN oxidoreductase RutF